MRLKIAVAVIASMFPCALFAQGLSSPGGLSANNGSGSLAVGTSPISGTCPTGQLLYNNAGILGCQAVGTATIAIGSTVTSGTAGQGLYVGAGSVLAQFAYGTNVFTALGNALNGASGLVGYSGSLGTPTQGVLTNATGLPISTGVSGLGANVGTALGSALNGSGAISATISPAFVTPALGAATATSLAIGGSTALTANAAASDVQAGTSGGLVVTPTALMGSAAPQVLAATGFAWNAAIGYNATATLTANTQAIPNPTNIFAGQTYTLIISPSTYTGYTWGTAFDWGSAGAPTLTASKQNVIACISTATWTSTPTANGLLCTASLGF